MTDKASDSYVFWLGFIQYPVQLLGAPEGIWTPNLLIRSFSLRLSKRVSKVLVLCSFALFKRKIVLFVSHYLLRYLYGWKQNESKWVRFFSVRQDTPDSPLSIFTAPSFTRAWLGTNRASASTKSFNNERIDSDWLRLGRDWKQRQGGYTNHLKKGF